MRLGARMVCGRLLGWRRGKVGPVGLCVCMGGPWFEWMLGGSEGREVGERHGLLGGLYGYSVEGVIGMGVLGIVDCWRMLMRSRYDTVTGLTG
jgi:hypothetical protein